jgi:hypothetical protein
MKAILPPAHRALLLGALLVSASPLADQRSDAAPTRPSGFGSRKVVLGVRGGS